MSSVLQCATVAIDTYVINSVVLNVRQESLVANETLESSCAVNQLMLSMHILLSLYFI